MERANGGRVDGRIANIVNFHCPGTLLYAWLTGRFAQRLSNRNLGLWSVGISSFYSRASIVLLPAANRVFDPGNPIPLRHLPAFKIDQPLCGGAVTTNLEQQVVEQFCLVDRSPE